MLKKFFIEINKIIINIKNYQTLIIMFVLLPLFSHFNGIFIRFSVIYGIIFVYINNI